MIRFFVLIGFSVVLFVHVCGCAGTKFQNPGSLSGDQLLEWSAQYPSSRYLTGVGLSSTKWGMGVALQRASDDALAAIAQIIEARVEHRQELFQRSTRHSTDQVLRVSGSGLSSFTRVSTVQIIQGIEFKEKYHDQRGRALYVLAVLDRIAASERLEREIQGLDYQVALLGEKARKAEAAGDLLAAIQVYRKTLGFSLKSDVLRHQHSVISSYASGEYGSEHFSAQLTLRFAELLKRIEIYVSAKGVGYIEGIIRQVMAGAGFSVRESAARSAGLTLQCHLNTVCHPGLGGYKGLYVCYLSLGVKIVDNRTKRIAGEITLLANSNAGDEASAKERALRLLSRSVKEKLVEDFYKALSIAESE